MEKLMNKMQHIHIRKFNKDIHFSKWKPYRIQKLLWSIFRGMLLFGLCFVFLYPLIYTLSVSLRSYKEIYDPGVVWIPKHVVFENIRDAFVIMNYPKALLSTIILNVVSSVLQIICCAFVGYGFARFKFKGKNILFSLVLLTIIIPPQTTIIPTYLNYRYFDFFGIGKIIGLITGKNFSINLLNTYWTFYLPAALGMGIRSGLIIYIFRQFFRGMPKELEDAAFIDGCGFFQTFLRVILPNAGAPFLTTFLFSIVWYWNDYYLSSMFFTDMSTVSLALSRLPSAIDNTEFARLLRNPYYSLTRVQAGCLLAIIPMLIIYILLQKHFTESIERTGIVG